MGGGMGNAQQELDSSYSILTDGPLFPVFTAGVKFMLVTAIAEPGDYNVFEKYLALSTIVDLGEVLFRTYVQGESGHYSEKNWKLAPSFSCLERHVFYDLPKLVFNKLKR